MIDEASKRTPVRSLIRAAALTGLAMTAQPVSADTMTAPEIAQRIVGKDLAARRMGMTVHLRYDSDGTVTIRAPFFTGTGTWDWQGDGLCMNVRGGPNPGRSCHAFEDLGDGRFRNSDGMVLRLQE